MRLNSTTARARPLPSSLRYESYTDLMLTWFEAAARARTFLACTQISVDFKPEGASVHQQTPGDEHKSTPPTASLVAASTSL